MHDFEEYEADYFGGCPCGRPQNRRRRHEQRNMWRDNRDWRPEAEDYADTRFMDEYGRNEMNRRQRSADMPEYGMGNIRGTAWDTGMPNRVTDEEVWKDMDEFEGLYDELETELMKIIRRICDTVDGDGCAAMEGQMNREMLEMMIDRVLQEAGNDRTEDKSRAEENRMIPDGFSFDDGTGLEAESVSLKDSDAVVRSLISSLLFHEMLRRRMRRRMHRRYRRESEGR